MTEDNVKNLIRAFIDGEIYVKIMPQDGTYRVFAGNLTNMTTCYTWWNRRWEFGFDKEDSDSFIENFYDDLK